MNKPILKIKNLKKIYHSTKGETLAIDNISIDIYEKEIVAIVGPSGCGKSTLLSILAGLEDKTSGEIIFNSKQKIGYMLQTDSLFPWRTILDNCLLSLEINHIKTKKNINKVLDLLDKYGLKDFKDNYPNNLSGGMKQR